jgi:transcriptional regulator with XRE-family HTH domain
MSSPADSPGVVHAGPNAQAPFGEHLRHWRLRRRMTQADLAHEAGLSNRHLSFIETGRATPSREMVLRLGERLQVPLRERNALLMAAGYAPMYRASALSEPALAAAREAVEWVLRGHEPYPALAIDRHWNLVSYNRLVPRLLANCSAELLQPPVNVLRLSLHPDGLAPDVLNLDAWRAHLLHRLTEQVQVTGDAGLASLLDELQGEPYRMTSARDPTPATGGIVIPLQLRTPVGVLNLISTTTVFGTPVDVTLQELAIESFFPADPETAARLATLAAP